MYLLCPPSSQDATFFLNTLKYVCFSYEVVKDDVDFTQLHCLHLHLFLEFKLKEIIGNLCSALAGENKHLVFANSHRKITARRRNFTALLNLKDTTKVQHLKCSVVVPGCMCRGCGGTEQQTDRQTEHRQASPCKSGYKCSAYMSAQTNSPMDEQDERPRF